MTLISYEYNFIMCVGENFSCVYIFCIFSLKNLSCVLCVSCVGPV